MDKTTFGKLVMENETQFYRIAKSILQSDEDCADAASEAVAKGFAALPTLKEDAYAKTWLIRILIRECWRIQKNNRRYVPLEESFHPSSAPQEYSHLYSALSQLPTHQRLPLVMYYLEGFSVKEIAEITELPAGTVKSRMARGRAKLRMSESPSRKNISLENTAPKLQKKSVVKRGFLLLAAALACTATALAASDFRLFDLFNLGKDTREAGSLIQTDPSLTAETEGAWSEPLLSIKESLFDGQILYLYASSAGTGQKYTLGIDRILINGKDSVPVTFGPDQTLENGCGYVLRADLESINVTPPFTVTLPLSVYEKTEGQDIALTENPSQGLSRPRQYENQEITYTVEVSGKVLTPADRSFAGSDYTLTVSNLSATSTRISFSCLYEMTPSQREAYENQDSVLTIPAVFDFSGEECLLQDAMMEDIENGIFITADYSGISLEDDFFIIAARRGIPDPQTGKINLENCSLENKIKIQLSDN